MDLQSEERVRERQKGGQEGFCCQTLNKVISLRVNGDKTRKVNAKAEL